ncbi:MAG: ABC transporter permease [Elusimicrobia bacterium]|nr:ABC transporter permease [Elusimicrobiota bacterium]
MKKIFNFFPSTLYPLPSTLPYVWLAWKITFYKGNPTIQKFSVLTAIFAIAFGTASLLVTIGGIDGFHQEIKQRILGLSPHVFIRLRTDARNIEKDAGILTEALASQRNLHLSPFVISQVMVRTPSGTLGMVLKAVDPRREGEVTGLRRLIKKGDWFDQSKTSDFSAKGGSASGGRLQTSDLKSSIPIIIGTEAAINLGLTVGSKAALLTSSGSDSFLSLPQIRSAEVAGIFESGYYEYDSSLVYASLNDVERLWGAGNASANAIFWLGIKGDDPEKAGQVAREISKELSSLPQVRQVLAWGEMNRSLFSALKLEKLMLTLVISLIIFIASIAVASNLIMISAMKTKMIGSLRSMGASRGEVLCLMLAVGGLLGILGVAAGLALTCPIALILLKTHWIRMPPEIYMIDRLPFVLDFATTAAVCLFAWAVSVLASVLPAYKTARLDASQILRYG